MSILAENRRRLFRWLRGPVLDRLLPQDCLLCLARAGGMQLCADCAAALPRLTDACCPRCAQPGGSGEVCGRCLRQPPHFDAMFALHPYVFPVDRMIHRLKYGHQLSIAEYFGRALATGGDRLHADLIVPMPLHASRLSERGFNQAREICRPLAREIGIPVDTQCCRRERATAPQEGLSLNERRQNLRNAFFCDRDFGGRRLLLVDDVATTGASADECARTLKLHGASHVTVAVVARTLLD